MYCTKCGAEIKEEDGVFCSSCGQETLIGLDGVVGVISLDESNESRNALAVSRGVGFTSSDVAGMVFKKNAKRQNAIVVSIIIVLAALAIAVLTRCCLNGGFDIDFNLANELTPAQELSARNAGRVGIFNGSAIGVQGRYLASFYDFDRSDLKKTSLLYQADIKWRLRSSEEIQAEKKAEIQETYDKRIGIERVASFSGDAFTSVVLDCSGCVYWCNASSSPRVQAKLDGGGWDSCIDIAAGNGYALGLHADGTVVASGANEQGQCDVADWSDVKQLCSDGTTTYGLRNHGTVLIAGKNESNGAAEPVRHWKNIVQIAASSNYVVGVRSDETVVKCSLSSDVNWLNTGAWNRVVAVSVSDDHAIGLKDDGSIVTAGSNSRGQCSLPEGVSNEGFVAMAAGPANTILVNEQGDVIWMGAFRDDCVWSDGYRFYKPKFTNLGDAR